MGVDAAVGEQSVEVEGAAVLQAGIHGGAVGGIFKEAAVLNGPGDSGQILINHTAAADIGVANLAVAHLAVRQSHIQPGGGEGGISALGNAEQPVQNRRARMGHGVSDGVLRKAKAVHNNQSSGCFIHNDLIPRFS